MVKQFPIVNKIIITFNFCQIPKNICINKFTFNACFMRQYLLLFQ